MVKKKTNKPTGGDFRMPNKISNGVGGKVTISGGKQNPDNVDSGSNEDLERKIKLFTRHDKLARYLVSKKLIPNLSFSAVFSSLNNISEKELESIEADVYLCETIDEKTRQKTLDDVCKTLGLQKQAPNPQESYKKTIDDIKNKNHPPPDLQYLKDYFSSPKFKDIENKLKDMLFENEEVKQLLDDDTRENKEINDSWPNNEDSDYKYFNTSSIVPLTGCCPILTYEQAIEKIQMFENLIAEKTKAHLAAKRELFVLNTALERAYKSIPQDDSFPKPEYVIPKKKQIIEPTLEEAINDLKEYRPYKSGDNQKINGTRKHYEYEKNSFRRAPPKDE